MCNNLLQNSLQGALRRVVFAIKNDTFSGRVDDSRLHYVKVHLISLKMVYHILWKCEDYSIWLIVENCEYSSFGEFL